MKYLGGLLNLLDAKMTVPGMYGGFHIFFFAVSILAGIVLCKHFRKPGGAFVRKLLLIVSLTVIVLEVYKQINFGFRYDGVSILFDYQWYAFPFQFCSTPMYIGLMAALTRSKHLHEWLCAYLSTYGLFAGLCVMFYPATVFVDTIGINIQTMICHGSMVTIGIYLLFSGYVRTERKTIFKALPVFAVLVGIAMVLNEAAYRTGLLETETFNMFFISPYCAPELPVYSLVQGVIPFPWSTIVYIGGFTFAGSFLLFLMDMMNHLLLHFRHHHHKPHLCFR